MRHKKGEISRTYLSPPLKGQGENNLTGIKPNHCNCTIQSLDGNKDSLIKDNLPISCETLSLANKESAWLSQQGWPQLWLKCLGSQGTRFCLGRAKMFWEMGRTLVVWGDWRSVGGLRWKQPIRSGVICWNQWGLSSRICLCRKENGPYWVACALAKFWNIKCIILLRVGFVLV